MSIVIKGFNQFYYYYEIIIVDGFTHNAHIILFVSK